MVVDKIQANDDDRYGPDVESRAIEEYNQSMGEDDPYYSVGLANHIENYKKNFSPPGASK